MPDDKNAGIGSSVQSATSTGTLTDQDVATRYGLSESQVHDFCREFNVSQDGGHFAIPATMLPELETWAKQKGYPIRGT